MLFSKKEKTLSFLIMKVIYIYDKNHWKVQRNVMI